MAETWKKLAFEDDVALKTLWNAHSVVIGISNDTPVVLELAEQEIIGRLTGANIDGIAIGITDNKLPQIDGGANDPVNGDYAKFTASGLEGKDKAGMLSDLNVADGADVTGSNAPQAHNTSHENGNGDEISVAALSGLLADDQHVLDVEVTAVIEATPLNDLAAADGAVDCGGQELQNMVLEQLADDSAKTALTAVVGMIAYQVDDAALYFCTEGE